MRRFRFPIAVALTSLALVLVLGGVCALVVRSAFASGPWFGRPGFGPGFGPSFELPAELRGLHDLPAAERFAHFIGVLVNLKDKDNQPLTINVTPGTATAVSTTSLTIAANDGSTRTFALNDQTIIRDKGVRGEARATEPTLARDDKVVVVTLDNSTTATAVMVGAHGFGPGGPHGPFGPGR
jgi:hypothetical protein